MKISVALFVPCYIDQFYPQVAIATMQLLQKLNCEVHFPMNQTCCGQPMANSGFTFTSKGCDRNFVENFSGYDYIVAPSGSCVLHFREHLDDEKKPKETEKIRSSIYELTEFLTDVLKVEKSTASFTFKVDYITGVDTSCLMHLEGILKRNGSKNKTIHIAEILNSSL